MSSIPDPLASLKRRIVATWCIGTVLVALCAVWAMSPSRDRPIGEGMSLTETQERRVAEHTASELDLSVFTAKLWNPPPLPVQPSNVASRPDPPPAREPLNLQLVGITNTEGHLIAALYDPKNDTMHLVGNGETIGTLHVTDITDEYVELDDGRGPRRVQFDPASSNRSGRQRSS